MAASNSQVPESITTNMTDFTAALQKLKKSLAAFSTAPHAELQGYSPLERAEAFLGLAECANVLCHMHLRASGTDPMEHNVKGEHRRLRHNPSWKFWEKRAGVCHDKSRAQIGNFATPLEPSLFS